MVLESSSISLFAFRAFAPVKNDTAAPIAAMADAHYLIEKSVENCTTVSRIRLLDEEESIDELSRMLGGVEITDKVRESAREMKELARKRKIS